MNTVIYGFISYDLSLLATHLFEEKIPLEGYVRISWLELETHVVIFQRLAILFDGFVNCTSPLIGQGIHRVHLDCSVQVFQSSVKLFKGMIQNGPVGKLFRSCQV